MLLDWLTHSFATVTPIYIRGGLAWEGAELYWLRRFLAARRQPSIRPLIVLDFPMQDLYAGHWSVTGKGVPDYFASDPECYLPGRNIMLLAKVGVYCAMHDIGTIAMGQLKGNPFPDSTPRFRRRLQSAYSLGLDYPLRLLTPFLKYTKMDVIRKGRHLPLQWTFSCVQPQGRTHCGVCTKCAERRKAFHLSGVPDPTRYAAAPPGRRALSGGRHAD